MLTKMITVLKQLMKVLSLMPVTQAVVIPAITIPANKRMLY